MKFYKRFSSARWINKLRKKGKLICTNVLKMSYFGNAAYRHHSYNILWSQLCITESYYYLFDYDIWYSINFIKVDYPRVIANILKDRIRRGNI